MIIYVHILVRNTLVFFLLVLIILIGYERFRSQRTSIGLEWWTQRERPKSRSLISCKLLGWLILIWEMEATCWRLLETIQQLMPLLQGQPLRLQHLPKGLSSCSSSQREQFWSSAFRWIWDQLILLWVQHIWKQIQLKY